MQASKNSENDELEELNGHVSEDDHVSFYWMSSFLNIFLSEIKSSCLFLYLYRWPPQIYVSST